MSELSKVGAGAAPKLAPPTSSRFEPRPGEALAIGVGAAVVFVLAVLMPPAAVIAPFPLMVLRLRTSLGSAVLGMLLAAALVAGLLSWGSAALFLSLAVPVLAVADTLGRGRGFVRGCVRGFALLALQVVAVLAFSGAQLRDRLLQPFAQWRSPEFVSTLGMRPDEVEQWLLHLDLWQSILSVVYPALCIVFAGLVILANAALLRAYLLRRDPGWLDGGEFESIRFPFPLAVLFVMAGALVAVAPARPVAYNVLLLLAFFFALQGLAVVGFYAARLAGPRFLRVAMVVLVLVNPWAMQILALLGLFDLWFDFRKWAEMPPEAGGSRPS
jgi:uncharacterized protein YybS (DUF2232 family)